MSSPVPRRIVVFDVDGTSTAVMDGVPARQVRDPARPGFSSVSYWVTDGAPVTLARPGNEPSGSNLLEPPPGGAICKLLTIPPDSTHVDAVKSEHVKAYFDSVGAPHASTHSPEAPHPYMQRTETLDFCIVVSGEATLVLDRDVVHLKAGDTVVQRATNHAWSNRSEAPCVIVVSSHDARSTPSGV